MRPFARCRHIERWTEDHIRALSNELAPQRLRKLTSEGGVPRGGEGEQAGPRGHLPHNRPLRRAKPLRGVLQMRRGQPQPRHRPRAADKCAIQLTKRAVAFAVEEPVTLGACHVADECRRRRIRIRAVHVPPWPAAQLPGQRLTSSVRLGGLGAVAGRRPLRPKEEEDDDDQGVPRAAREDERHRD